MQALPFLLLAPFLGVRTARGELGSAVALLQDSLRVNRVPAAAASEWWIFGRHRRARDQPDEVEPFTSFPLESYGEAEPVEAAANSSLAQPTPWEAGAVLAATKPAASMPFADALRSEDSEAQKSLKEKLKEKLLLKEREAEEKPPAAEQGQPSLYKVGDSIQVMDMKSTEKGNMSWVDCSVTGLGSAPGTFNIFVSAAPEGQQDYSDVPAKFLRRPAPPYRYKAGDVMRIRVSGGDKAGAWVPCKITSKGKEEDTYRVHVPMAPPGQQDADAVPAAALRPADDPGEYAAMELMLNSNPGYRQHLAAFKSAAREYAAGEAAEVQVAEGPHKGAWVPCTIVGKGSQELTYRISSYGEEFDHVHVVSLRKAPAGPAPAESQFATLLAEEPQEFNAGDVAEVLLKAGPNAGSWIKVSIVGKGEKPQSYNINTGIEEFPNVPAASLRRGDTAASWDV